MTSPISPTSGPPSAVPGDGVVRAVSSAAKNDATSFSEAVEGSRNATRMCPAVSSSTRRRTQPAGTVSGATRLPAESDTGRRFVVVAVPEAWQPAKPSKNAKIEARIFMTWRWIWTRRTTTGATGGLRLHRLGKQLMGIGSLELPERFQPLPPEPARELLCREWHLGSTCRRAPPAPRRPVRGGSPQRGVAAR